jgi:uncharacterized UBP type Zn finger protein
MRKGIGKYKLCAFISHMGSSPHSGHYVAHVKRDNGIWYIFNDEKVFFINIIVENLILNFYFIGRNLSKST